MNTTYKWYSHNTNIIQFFSDFLPSKKVSNKVDFIQDSSDQTYDYSAYMPESDTNTNWN